MQNLRDFILEMAAKIRETHRKIRGYEFLEAYGKLLDRLYPFGYEQTLVNMQQGNGPAIEFALVFAEAKPYYFRSQYQRTKLIRLLKHAKLSSLQKERLERILAADHEKKINSQAHADRKALALARRFHQPRNG